MVRHTLRMRILERCAIGLLSVCLWQAVSSASAPDLHYRIWTTEQGLPQGSVRHIAQTPDGYLWIATFDGLVRFDGVRMVVFSKSDVPEMTSNRCLSLAVDRRGALWVATEDGGILQVVGRHVRAFGRSSGLESNILITITVDADGRVWTLTANGPEVFDGTRWSRPTGTARFPESSAPREIRALLDERGLQGLPDTWRWALGANGRVWLAEGGRLRRSERGQWTAFPTPLPSIVLPEPSMLFEDREGSLWIGGDHGLVQASPSAVRSIVPDDPGQRNIYTLAEDTSGRVWIGPQGGPLVWDHGVLTSLMTLSWWPKAAITSILPDADGSVLAGGPARIYRVWPGRGFEQLGIVPTTHVSAFLRDRRGTLWAATGVGLLRWTGKTWEQIEGLPSPDLKVLLETHDGALWAGGYGGLARIADGRIQQTWTTRNGLPSDRIRALTEDDSGTLWIGTYDGGLIRFARGAFVSIRKRDGLFDDGAFAILDGGDGRYYMSSNRGVYSVAMRELDAFANGSVPNVTSRAYRAADGMPSSECNGGLQPAGFRAADGTLWFPTQGGIAIIDPKAVRENATPPTVVIEEVTTDRRTLSAEGAIALLPGERHLEIRYTANTFVRPEGAHFRYRLSGFDAGWVEAGTRRFALYPYIPPGHYTLTVASANSDGVWNREGASLPIRVLPFWWETVWLRGGAGILALVGLVAGYRWRVSALHRRRAEQDRFARRLIESQEAERQRIAYELHDGIGQTLIVIRNRALLGVRDARGSAQVEQLNEISAVAAEAIEDVRKVAYGLRPYQLDHLGLTRALRSLVERTAASSGIAITADIADLGGLVKSEDEINVYRIVQEAISNIVRHAHATSGSVSVAVRERDIEIRVDDNGTGFDPVAASIRGGLGLSGIAERARILGGNQSVRSAPAQGTTVIVRVPSGRPPER